MTERTTQRWVVVVPPLGAARSVGLSLVGAFQEELGRDVLVIDSKAYLDGYRSLMRNPEDDLIIDLFGQSLLTKSLEFRATHVLVLALSPVTMYFLNLLRGQKICAMHWFIEDYRRAEYWRDVALGYDIFFAIQRGPVQNFCSENGIAYEYLPNATVYDQQPPPIAWSLRRFDVGFIGLPSPYRIDMLERLAASGLSVAIAGEGWDACRGLLKERILQSGWIGPQQAAEFYRNCRMVVNLGLEDPSSDREHRQVSPRAWDAVFCGSALLTEQLPLNASSLEGIERVEFESPTEMLVKALALRENGWTQEQLIANQRVVQNQHLLIHRVRALLQSAQSLVR